MSRGAPCFAEMRTGLPEPVVAAGLAAGETVWRVVSVPTLTAVTRMSRIFVAPPTSASQLTVVFAELLRIPGCGQKDLDARAGAVLADRDRGDQVRASADFRRQSTPRWELAEPPVPTMIAFANTSQRPFVSASEATVLCRVLMATGPAFLPFTRAGRPPGALGVAAAAVIGATSPAAITKVPSAIIIWVRLIRMLPPSSFGSTGETLPPTVSDRDERPEVFDVHRGGPRCQSRYGART